MDNTLIFLLHWEAQYPFEQIQHSLSAWKPPEAVSKNSLYIALPTGYLQQASKELASSGFSWGVNDMIDASPESFTAVIAAKLSKKVQAQFVLIGSDFKRHKMGESLASLQHKVRKALGNDITPFLCFSVSESDQGRDKSLEAIKMELKAVLEGLSSEEIQRIRFVYDFTPEKLSFSDVTPSKLQEAYETCLQAYTDLFGDDTARSIKTLCAFPPYYSLSKNFTEKSSFAGFYFKMTNTHMPLIEAI